MVIITALIQLAETSSMNYDLLTTFRGGRHRLSAVRCHSGDPAEQEERCCAV